MTTTKWDYIIVGAGSAGCLLANRLTGAGHRVLLLEAGGEDRNFWIHLPVGYFKTIFDTSLSRQFETEPQSETGNRKIIWPRGRVLGGSSSINGLIYIRGQHADYDDWERQGATGWGYREVLPYFRKSERYAGPSNEYHGTDGELGVSELRNDHPYCERWLQAAQQFGLPANADFNGPTDYGVGAYQLSIRNGWRSSAAVAFLRPARQRTQLTVMTRTEVNRVLFKGKQAIGVECQTAAGLQQFHAEREVILSAGALQSPQLLQLSGVGPASLLRGLGINVVADVEEVGQNLQDHYQARTIIRLKERQSLNTDVRNPFKLASMGWQWLMHNRGPLTVGAGQVGGFARTKHARDDRADIQFNVMPLSVDRPGDPLHRFPGFTVSACQCRPLSRGRVEIVSRDPRQSPKIISNYLTERHDLDVLVDGLRICRDIYQQPAFRDLWAEEVLPGKDELQTFAQNKGGTVFHPTSTCRMGRDQRAVVDPQLRVNGVENLRVIDASVMPSVISANTNAATIMIAERGAAMILS